MYVKYGLDIIILFTFCYSVGYLSYTLHINTGMCCMYNTFRDLCIATAYIGEK